MNFHPLPRSKYRVSIKFRNRNACFSTLVEAIFYTWHIYSYRSPRSIDCIEIPDSYFSMFRAIFSNLHAIKIVLVRSIVSKFSKIQIFFLSFSPFFFFFLNRTRIFFRKWIDRKKKKNRDKIIPSFIIFTARRVYSSPVITTSRRFVVRTFENS